ncbi:unnamed protein product [Scytosiphon promiscuus]
MRSMHDAHVDLIRLLAATERLAAVQNASADGSWEHWPRFCQFLTSLDNIQSQLQARVLDGSRGDGGEGIDANNNGSPKATAPSAQDLAEYDQRLENLRRKRDDLVSAAAAAAAAAAETAADVEMSEQQEQRRRQALSFADAGEGRTGEGGGGSEGNNSDGRMEQQRQRRDTTARNFSSNSQRSRNNKSRKMYGDPRGGGGGDGLFGGRGHRQAGEVGGRAADEAEADEVAQEISSMAGRLKESSMAINQTLRTQTQVLEDTGDAATMNVDRVKRENVRVAERLRKKRAAMFASWCMMITVLAVFFATYALVILPFEKRRGPFVATRSPTFAHAAEQTPPIPSQVNHSTPIEGDGVGEEDPRKRAERAYSEASRRARSREKSDNAAHRVANAEKEAFRERQAERMMASAKERKAGMRRKGLERQQAQIEGVRDAEEDQEGLQAGSCSAPPSDGDDDTAAVDVGSCSGPPPSDEDDGVTGDGSGSCSVPHSDEDGGSTAADTGSCSAPPSDKDGDHTAAAVGSCSAPPSDEDGDHTAAAVGSCSAPPSDDDSAAAFEDAAERRIDPPVVDDAASTDAREGAGAATPPALDQEAAKAGEEYRRKAQLAYEERAKREAQRIESSNAGLRLVAEEKEKYRQRQAQEMMQRATERKTKASAAKKAREAQRAGASVAFSGREAEEEDAESSLRARADDYGGEGIGSESGSSDGAGGPQDGGGEEGMKAMFDDDHREGTVRASDGDGSTTGADAVGESSDDGSSVFTPSAEAREVERRLAEEAKLAYERNSRQTEDTLATQNAGLRLVAEEKEKYRQRQTTSILEGAKHRKQQQQQQQEQQQQLQQHGEAGDDQPETGESQPPTPEESESEKKVDGPVSTSVSTAGGATSGSATEGGGGRGEGLEAVRMRLRESLSSKRGGAEGEGRDSNSNNK